VCLGEGGDDYLNKKIRICTFSVQSGLILRLEGKRKSKDDAAARIKAAV